MSQTYYDSAQLRILQTDNQDIPNDGPRTLPLTFDFTAYDSYVVDLGSLEQQGRISMVQTVFVDTSGTDKALTIKSRGSNQVLTVKGRTNGYYNILASSPTVLEFTCVGGPAALSCQLVNVPIAGAVWATQ